MSAPFYTDGQVTLWHGDAVDVLSALPEASVDCVVTSPPYFGLRDYGVDGQYGLEATPGEFVAAMVEVFAQVRRVLVGDGTLWLNLGDTYSTHQRGSDNGWDTSRLSNPARVQKMQFAALREGRHTAFDVPEKNLMGIPWRIAFALQDDGWTLRNAIIWHKPNAMPESVTDRLATRYEHLFLFSKNRRYWFDLDPIREPLTHPDRISGHTFGGANKAAKLTQGSAARRTGGTYTTAPAGGRNPGDVWSIPTQPFPGAHFATYPEELARRAVLAGCPPQRCTSCGHAPARITATEQHDTGRATNGPRSIAQRHETAGYTTRTVAQRTTIGWTSCGHETHRPGIVLDPFNGSGTTGLAATRNARHYIGIDLNPDYLNLSLRTRLAQAALIPEDGAA